MLKAEELRQLFLYLVLLLALLDPFFVAHVLIPSVVDSEHGDCACVLSS